MSTASKIVAAIARIPVNFVKEVAQDIKTLNEIPKKTEQVELTEEEIEMIEARRAAKARGAK